VDTVNKHNNYNGEKNMKITNILALLTSLFPYKEAHPAIRIFIRAMLAGKVSKSFIDPEDFALQRQIVTDWLNDILKSASTNNSTTSSTSTNSSSNTNNMSAEMQVIIGDTQNLKTVCSMIGDQQLESCIQQAVTAKAKTTTGHNKKFGKKEIHFSKLLELDDQPHKQKKEKVLKVSEVEVAFINAVSRLLLKYGDGQGSNETKKRLLASVLGVLGNIHLIKFLCKRNDILLNNVIHTIEHGSDFNGVSWTDEISGVLRYYWGSITLHNPKPVNENLTPCLESWLNSLLTMLDNFDSISQNQDALTLLESVNKIQDALNKYWVVGKKYKLSSLCAKFVEGQNTLEPILAKIKQPSPAKTSTCSSCFFCGKGGAKSKSDSSLDSDNNSPKQDTKPTEKSALLKTMGD
jgi:hypothetical protein